ncbi:MAG TPA: ABC transporter permease [Chitinophagaceae bacterium]|jgi:putative ABC transport system permease protein
MISSYLKIALRNLIKRKGYTILNVAGLAIGITCCLLIFQYVAFEKSYDTFEPQTNQVVRLRLDSYQQGKLAWQSATSYPAFGPTLKKDFPEVEDYCRLIDANLLLSNDERNIKFKEEKGYFADPSFLNMFNVQLVKGNLKTALDAPDKILLSENTAKKYFGNEDPLGKRLTDRDPDYTRTFEVTGVFKEFPANSHLIINHLVSYSTLGSILRFYGDTSNSTETSFGWYDFYTYLKLRPGTDVKKFESKLPAYCDKYVNGQEWNKTNNVHDELYVIPLSDIHLYSNYNQEAEVNGNGQSVSFLFLIAFFIIGIAWINFINLATARSMERAREVGVRKVLGALRSNLINQFLIESFLLNLVAFFLALACVYLLAPWFNQFTDRAVQAGFSLPAQYWAGFIGMFLFGSFLSGIYPAFVLSGYQPVTVLKGLFKGSSSGFLLRKGLIIAQFATSIILIAGTIIVYQQVNYMRKQNLGVNINQTLVLRGAESVTDSVYQNVYQPFKTELLKIPGVKNVAASSSIMGKEIYWTNGSHKLGPNYKAVTLYNLGVDYDFIPAFNLRLIAGRNFSKDFKTDQKGVLLNERAAQLLGFNDYNKAVNESFFSSGDTVKLLGIVSNYHHQGLQKAIDPMILRLRPNSRDAYSIKIESRNIQATVSSAQKVWNKYFPADPFNYFFLDDYFNQQYSADQLFGKVFGLFAFLAILIACFGLLGLSAYNVLQRTKEIGIRKILGASTQNLLFLLSKDFLLLVLLAFIIATPVAWWVMHNWLQGFAYRVSIYWWVFAAAGIISVLIALITISFQAVKAAIANPVKSLRTE